MQALRMPNKLPDVGLTIFSHMSALAQQHQAVNLGQGFPDFEPDPSLLAGVQAALAAGHHQYPPMAGVPALRQAVAAVLARQHGVQVDPDREVTITAGGTQGLFTALQCGVGAGNEVLVIEPAYDSYGPAIRLAGGVPVGVPMTPDYRIDWDAVRAALTPRTRVLVLNTPHNPSGRVARAADLHTLAQLAEAHDLLVVSDEVYEHMVFDGAPHESVARHPALAARSFLVTSFGKTFHVTGWKVGAVVAPPALTEAFRRLHQFTVFTVNTPMQHALAAQLAEPRHWEGLAHFYAGKRDRFRAGLAGTGLRLLPCEGTYFQTVDYRAVSDLPEQAFAEWLTRDIGVAAIPLAGFYQVPQERGHVRFCFAKRDDTLDRALERLQQLPRRA